MMEVNDQKHSDISVPVSVLIPVLNEAKNLPSCIASVQWSEDVVVVDSGSTDETADLALRHGARVVSFQYVPGGVKKKNWALRNVDFKHDWVLILDADEQITPSLAWEIAQVVQTAAEPVAYYINRRFFFLGRWIRRCGYYPSWNLRLLKRGYGFYEFIPDSSDSGDNEVHEHMLVSGKAGYLRHPMDHYAYPDIKTFVEKHNRYSTWEASVARAYLDPTNESGRGEMAFHLRLRRFLKLTARRLPFPDHLRFVYHYFLRLGFLDGRAGYILCKLLAEYEFLIWAKMIENRCWMPSTGAIVAGSKTGSSPGDLLRKGNSVFPEAASVDTSVDAAR